MLVQDAPATELANRLPDATRLGLAELQVSDLSRSVDFYREAVGLVALDRSAGRAELGGEGGDPVLRLVEKRGAAPKPRTAVGLFHIAVLLPERRDLARAFARLASNGLLTGASDHLVSEALYLDDPDGLGVEIYRDRPRNDWPFENGRLKMASDRIDAAGLMALAEAEGDLDGPAPAGTRLGHVHLQVGDLDRAGAFWTGAVGLDLVTTYPGALFMSAGGYHHHVAANVWSSRGAGVPPEDTARLTHFEMLLPSEDDVAEAARRIEASGGAVTRRDGGVLASDPWGSGVLLRVA
ncbi:VOC family protein [Chelatococcus sambhunathii]|uniref:VOC family protein n=1 Tax=Chelatococcus sambhunathii TaxID=363953 RepID=A0ABU1DIV1_9HYPH|nr:VOC family protein [Chelatococcus sambhunathii]MDR4308055.1 VOC family protein [Chelatococcus sambhunathii]